MSLRHHMTTENVPVFQLVHGLPWNLSAQVLREVLVHHHLHQAPRILYHPRV